MKLLYLGNHSLKYILLLAPVTLCLSKALREEIDRSLGSLPQWKPKSQSLVTESLERPALLFFKPCERITGKTYLYLLKI